MLMLQRGWNWSAFIAGPFWYLSNGLLKKGLLLLSLIFLTFGLGIPIIFIYCGFSGNSDLHEKFLADKSKYDFDKI